MKLRLMFSLVAICLTLASCDSADAPDPVKTALENAGRNQSELLNVLKHYSNDSLRLQAAYYLISHLDGKYYYDGELLDRYMEYPKLVLREIDRGEYIMKSFNRIYGPFSLDLVNRKYDIQEISAAQLILNIDAAFKVWEEQPWAHDYSFDQFCNYVLPFRIGDEVPAYNRLEIYKRFTGILDTIPKAQLTAVYACKAINDALIAEGWTLSSRAGFLPHYNASTVLDYRVGSCREMASLAVYSMRAAGIPVTTDFLPQWPCRTLGHSWNVVIDKNGKFIPFLGAEDSPGTPHKPRRQKGKVYRNVFQENPLSLAKLADKKEAIPSFLTNPCIIDVTDEYAKTHDVAIGFNNQADSCRFGYLSVFNSTTWVPIAWSKLRMKKATFEKVEGDIVYLPSYFDTQGVSPAGYPFILDTAGQIKYLVPDTVNRIKELTCNRIFPTMPDSYMVDRAGNGKFQGANRADFSDAKDLSGFDLRALPFWNELPVQHKEKFRYIRFISPRAGGCHVAELEFYSGTTKLKGRPMAQWHAAHEIQKAFDADELTSYGSDTPMSWIGVDLGSGNLITQIRFLPELSLTPTDFIIPGKTYTLKYWDGNGWTLIGRKVATDTTVTFYNTPSNALFTITVDDPRVKDCRIFTYVSGRQVWW